MLCAAAFIGCTSQTVKDTREPAWQVVALPTGVRPTSLAAERDLIIGGRRGTGPWLATLTRQNGIRTVPLDPHSPYAGTAELVSIATYQGKIAALGNIRGGAHGNSRWSAWTGDTGGLTEYPQPFDTFGGVNAGDLEAVVINSAGPLITGSYRFGDSGLDGGVWISDTTPVGEHWAQPDPTGTALDTTRSVLVSIRAAAADTDQVLLAGSTTHLGSGVHQVASVWVRPDGSRWQRIELPESGKRGEALSAGCWADAGRQLNCLIAGTADGRLVAWTLAGTRVHRVDGLPAASMTDSGARPAVIGNKTIRAIAYSLGSQTGLLYETGGRWQRGAGPDGQLVSAVGFGNQAYVITERGSSRKLSRAALPRAQE